MRSAGLRARLWSDIWPIIRHQVDAVMRRGEATWSERAELSVKRRGYPELASFTWSMSPLIDDQGGVGGLICACVEDTPRMLAEQQRDLLMSQVQSERTRLAEAFSHSPAFIALLNGTDHRIEFLNDRFYQLVGRRGLVGKTVREALPEVVSQGFVDRLDRVFRDRRLLRRHRGADRSAPPAGSRARGGVHRLRLPAAARHHRRDQRHPRPRRRHHRAEPPHGARPLPAGARRRVAAS